MPHSCGSATSCANMQVGHSTGQVVVHVAIPNNSHAPQCGLPVAHEMPVATIGTAIPPCHSSVICLSARCLHACDLESHRSEAVGEGGAEAAPRVAVDTSGARVLTVRRMQPLYFALRSLTVPCVLPSSHMMQYSICNVNSADCVWDGSGGFACVMYSAQPQCFCGDRAAPPRSFYAA